MPSADLVAAMADRTVSYAEGVAKEAGGTAAASRLYVQNATGGTLTGVSSQIGWFTDRPYREAGQRSTENFLSIWDAGVGSFADDPPNADFTCAVAGEVVNYVVELTAPSIAGDNLSYAADSVGDTVLPQALQCESDSHLFIDVATAAQTCAVEATGTVSMSSVVGTINDTITGGTITGEPEELKGTLTLGGTLAITLPVAFATITATTVTAKVAVSILNSTYSGTETLTGAEHVYSGTITSHEAINDEIFTYKTRWFMEGPEAHAAMAHKHIGKIPSPISIIIKDLTLKC